MSQLNKYPFIEEIEIGEGHSQAKEILKTIGKASHDHDCEYTGFAKGNIRFASPIYVSIIKAGARFRPIITTLACFPDPNRKLQGADKSIDFKKEILKW